MKEKAKSQKQLTLAKSQRHLARKTSCPKNYQSGDKVAITCPGPEPKQVSKKDSSAKKSTQVNRLRLTPEPLAATAEAATPGWSEAAIQQSAFFKWCDRRNEGLPEDLLAD
jgi:hypothetical protein